MRGSRSSRREHRYEQMLSTGPLAVRKRAELREQAEDEEQLLRALERATGGTAEIADSDFHDVIRLSGLSMIGGIRTDATLFLILADSESDLRWNGGEMLSSEAEPITVRFTQTEEEEGITIPLDRMNDHPYLDHRCRDLSALLAYLGSDEIRQRIRWMYER